MSDTQPTTVLGHVCPPRAPFCGDGTTYLTVLQDGRTKKWEVVRCWVDQTSPYTGAQIVGYWVPTSRARAIKRAQKIATTTGEKVLER